MTQEFTDASVKELLMEALNAAKLAGAGFADARIQRSRNNVVSTRAGRTYLAEQYAGWPTES